MLKLNYTEVGLYMERSLTAPELLIAQHVSLAMRLGEPLYVEPSRAAFLLPASIAELAQLELALAQDASPAAVIPIDDEFVEVNLSGSWVAAGQTADEGMFLTVLNDRAEGLICKLWQMTVALVSALA